MIERMHMQILEEAHSRGIVVYTVTSPATAPTPNVILFGIGWPGGALLCTNCLSVVYVVKRMAEFAPTTEQGKPAIDSV